MDKKHAAKKQNKDVLFTVVIPVYNVEDYIEDCLNSVLCQMDEDVEVILVNDGSTDDSYAICEKIVSQNANKKMLLIHQENQGLSAARNAGMLLASGKYITFLDSDDMLVEDTFSKLKGYVLQHTEVEVFFYDAKIQNDMGETVVEGNYNRAGYVESVILDGKEYFRNFYMCPKIVSACLCLYQTTFLKKNKYLFEKGRLHEDVFFSFRNIVTAEKVLYLPEVFYIRRYREGSIMTVQRNQKHIEDYVYACEQCIELYEKVCKTDTLFCTMSAFVYSCFKYLIKFDLSNDSFKKYVEHYFDDTVCFLSKYIKKSAQITPYKVLLEMLQCGEEQKLQLGKKAETELCQALSVEARNTLQKVLREKLQYMYATLFEQLPTWDETYTLGIYGAGKQGKRLLEYYCGGDTPWKCKVLFIDGKQSSISHKIMNRDVVNIETARQCVDAIIISSYANHVPMKKMCEQNMLDKDIQIIDMYEIEKINLF